VTRRLTTEQARRIARRAAGGPVHGRDIGPLDAAVHRPHATHVFCAKDGIELDPPDDEPYDLVVAVAAGDVDDVAEIARALARRAPG
jgi:hypothetical protein